jgi:murein peptide amidase A
VPRLVVVVCACFVLVGCGAAGRAVRDDGRATAREAWVRAGGLRAPVPAGWHARRIALPASPDRDVLLQVATVPLDRRGPPEKIGTRDVVVTLTPVPGAVNLGRRTGPPRLRPADFRRVPARERPVGHDVARRVVALRGLSVRVQADFGSRPAPPGRVAQVDRLLGRLDAAQARRAARGRPPALDALLRPTGPRLWAGARVGRSAQGRPITLTASGDPSAARRALVVGCIHGTECAGIAVARRVQRGQGGCPPADADIWAVPDLDPDGRRLGTRLNGSGVDLNRNFPASWRPIGRPGDPQYSGPRPFSEPETRAARAIVRAFRPRITVWFHQQGQPLVRAWGASVPAARRYARLVGLPFRRMPWPAGTAPRWQNTAFPGSASFVVELRAGPLSARGAERHAQAILRLAGVGSGS